MQPTQQTAAYKALLLSLPTGGSAVRMRVWRAVKASGAAVLRDGVYILPRQADSGVFEEIDREVRGAGGFALAAGLTIDAGDETHVRNLFDRTAEYTALTRRIKAAHAGLSRSTKAKAEPGLARLRRAFEDVARIDFYPGHAKTQAEEALADLEREAKQIYAEGEPRPKKSKLRRLDPAKYRGRTWATRAAPWVDRLASAWLVRRFIDQKAKFVWLDRPSSLPPKAVGYDFDGAEFTHVGNRITFEVLIASFGLESDSALASIAAVVHFLDAGGIPVPDARGLETVLRGICQRTENDDERAIQAFQVFDHLYAAYSSG